MTEFQFRTMGQGSEPQIMGIWNVSPDSFSSCCEGGSATTIAHARELVRQGVDILDIGAESTRPGATPIDAHEEIRRLAEPLVWARENAACFEEDKKGAEHKRADYINRLKPTRRIASLYSYVLENDFKKGYRVSEDGTQVLDRMGNVLFDYSNLKEDLYDAMS